MPRSIRNESKHRESHSRHIKPYSHSRDCWNCGSSKHLKDQCPRTPTLRCSYCQRKGVRSIDCKCQRVKKQRIVQSHDNYESAVLLTVEMKKVRSVINTAAQESRMGTGVLAYLKTQRPVQGIKKVIRSAQGLETLQVVEVKMGADQRHQYAIDICVDNKIPKNEISLGFRALVRLGYRFSVCGLEGRQRRISTKKNYNRSTEGGPKEREDDEISFLDEEEAHRIEEWRD